MPIRYYVVQNKLTEDPDDYYARVQSSGTLTLKNIIGGMMELNNEQTEQYSTATVELFFRVLIARVVEGYTVSLPIGYFKAIINGPFNVFGAFEKGVNSAAVQFSAGGQFIEAVEAGDFVKISTPLTEPSVLQFYDLESKKTDSTLTPASIGRLSGEGLKFEEIDTDGVFFINQADETVTKVTLISVNLPSKIDFKIPELPAGNYWVEVRKTYGTTTKDVRPGRLKATLVVA